MTPLKNQSSSKMPEPLHDGFCDTQHYISIWKTRKWKSDVLFLFILKMIIHFIETWSKNKLQESKIMTLQCVIHNRSLNQKYKTHTPTISAVPGNRGDDVTTS